MSVWWSCPREISIQDLIHPGSKTQPCLGQAAGTVQCSVFVRWFLSQQSDGIRPTHDACCCCQTRLYSHLFILTSSAARRVLPASCHLLRRTSSSYEVALRFQRNPPANLTVPDARCAQLKHKAFALNFSCAPKLCNCNCKGFLRPLELCIASPHTAFSLRY